MKLEDNFIADIVKQVVSELGQEEKWQQFSQNNPGNEVNHTGRTVQSAMGSEIYLEEIGEASKGHNPKEVGIGIGPAYGKTIQRTINGLNLMGVLKEMMAGIEEEGMIPRIVRVTRTSDVCFMGNDTAKLMGSGIAIGLQSKGTAVIHQKDLYPLTNLELFPQAPLLTLEIYRIIGRNAAKYAKGERVIPVATQNDPMVRPKYQVKAALMHTVETELVVDRGSALEIQVKSK